MSLSVAVTLSCVDVPAASGLMGAIATLTTTALDTVTPNVALSPFRVPVMVAVPGCSAVTRPELRPTLAMAGALLVQLTLAVTSTVLPSL
ncbi:hypothetical protein D3C76_1201620 [compost metagenome]